MTFEDDLRVALTPLAGDPRATAAAVLERLPPPRAGFWRPLLWVALGAAAGALGGFWLGRAGAAAGAPPPPQLPEVRPEPASDLALARLVLGPVKVEVAGQEEQALWTLARVASGARLTTGERAFAALQLRDGSELRLHAETAVHLLGLGWLRLERGQIWLRNAGLQVWRIDSVQGTVAAELGALDVQAKEATLRVVALEGDVKLANPDGLERRVRQGQACAVRDGVLGDREFVVWPGEVIAWQLPLMHGEPFAREARLLAEDVASMLDKPEYEELAKVLLRRMGPVSADALVGFLGPDKAEGRRAARPIAAAVLADTATYPALERLFELLGDPDPGVRQGAYAGIKRISGVERGSAEFWAQAPLAERERAARAWLEDARR